MTLQDFFNPVLCGSLILSGRPFNFEAIPSRAKKNFKLLSKTDQQAPTITVLTSLREIWSVKLTKKNSSNTKSEHVHFALSERCGHLM